MRIISDFHDYYDCIQSHGQDDAIVWIRRPEVLRVDVERPRTPGYLQDLRCQPFPLWSYVAQGVRSLQYMIGFCGKVYPCIKLWKGDLPGESTAASLCYTIDEVDTFVDQNVKEEERKRYYKWLHGQRIPSAHARCQSFFERCEQQHGSHEHWFVDHHCPVFVAEYEQHFIVRQKSYSKSFFKITFNASLKDLLFYRRFDAQAAFQEITMYYGGVLGGTREYVPDVPDDVLSEAKGFDKWSFRKPPDNARGRTGSRRTDR
jgi:hypothetical protein